jgi:hypothetical protein
LEVLEQKITKETKGFSTRSSDCSNPRSISGSEKNGSAVGGLIVNHAHRQRLASPGDKGGAAREVGLRKTL